MAQQVSISTLRHGYGSFWPAGAPFPPTIPWLGIRASRSGFYRQLLRLMKSGKLKVLRGPSGDISVESEQSGAILAATGDDIATASAADPNVQVYAIEPGTLVRIAILTLVASVGISILIADCDTSSCEGDDDDDDDDDDDESKDDDSTDSGGGDTGVTGENCPCTGEANCWCKNAQSTKEHFMSEAPTTRPRTRAVFRWALSRGCPHCRQPVRGRVVDLARRPFSCSSCATDLEFDIVGSHQGRRGTVIVFAGFMLTWGLVAALAVSARQVDEHVVRVLSVVAGNVVLWALWLLLMLHTFPWRIKDSKAQTASKN